MTVDPEELKDNDYTNILLSTVSEITTGPFVYCGIQNGEPIFMYTDTWTEAVHIMNHFLGEIMDRKFKIHTLDDGWVNYVQTFFRRMKCKDAIFMMKDDEDNYYHAVNGTRKNVAHALVEAIEFLYGEHDEQYQDNML